MHATARVYGGLGVLAVADALERPAAAMAVGAATWLVRRTEGGAGRSCPDIGIRTWGVRRPARRAAGQNHTPVARISASAAGHRGVTRRRCEGRTRRA